jgi:hypothetical protein
MRLGTRPTPTRFLLSIVLLTGLVACGPAAAGGRQVYALATPASQQPAAGICATFPGKLVTVTIFPDLPDPRCAIVQPDQTLQVVNRTLEQLDVHIGPFDASLAPGGDYTFSVPFGKYLAPGVHRVQVLPCCGPELWLQAGTP